MRSSAALVPILSLALTGAFLPIAPAEVEFELRGKTKDRVRSYLGNAKLGSFGAPSINAKGAVAYASVLFGPRVSSSSNNTVIFKRNKRVRPLVGVQAGLLADEGFQGQIPNNSIYVENSSRLYRISRDVALNDRNQIAFTTEAIYGYQSRTERDNGTVVLGRVITSNASAYGLTTLRGGFFETLPTVSFLSFNDSTLRITASVNNQGAVGYNALFGITTTKFVPGVAYSGYTVNRSELSYIGSRVATVESTVIGLPYFTEFRAFSPAVIANGNRLFLVADISDQGDEFDGIWQGTNPNLQPIVVKDTPAPDGGEFTSFEGRIGANRQGSEVAFIANLSNPSGRGVFRANRTGKRVTRVASVGDNAPRNSASGAIGNFTGFELAAVNDIGQVAILGAVTSSEGGVRSGIWLSDRNGENLQLIVIEGQEIDVDGRLKRITRLAYNPISGLNRKGQVAFTASFSDRTSAVFVASVSGR